MPAVHLTAWHPTSDAVPWHVALLPGAVPQRRWHRGRPRLQLRSLREVCQRQRRSRPWPFEVFGRHQLCVPGPGAVLLHPARHLH